MLLIQICYVRLPILQFYFFSQIVAANQNEGGNVDVDQILQTFTGKQQGGLTSLFDTLAGSLGKKVKLQFHRQIGTL